MIPRRSLGSPGLEVSVLGLGAGGLGAPALSDRDVQGLLGRARELGVNLVDTAPSYGESEARLGRALAGQRDAWVVSTKVGYGVPGVPDWTGPCITLGVEQALRRLGTEHLDIVHLHSCPAEVLERGEVVAALTDAVRAGKVRAAAYSGDAHPLYVAVESGAFTVVQATLSLLDQHNAPTLALARRRGLGVIAKRVLANAPWRFDHEPERPDEATYWRRWREAELDLAAPQDAALRFAAHHPAVSTALIGTRSTHHLEAAARAVAAGPLAAETAELLARRFAERGTAWSPIT